MRQWIDTRDPLSCAYWCGHLSGTGFELMEALRATRSWHVGVVGLYLATHFTRDEAENRMLPGSVCSVD